MSNNIGPTKRSADFNDYVELESKLAKANDEIKRLKDYNQKLLISLNRRDQIIKDNKIFTDNPSGIINIDSIKQYVNLKNKADELRKENNAKSAKFGSNNESGAYNTPVNVIDAGLNWTRKSIEICNDIAKKLGLI